MFGRNKKINDNLDLILDRLNWLNIKNIINTLNQNSKDIMNIYKKIEKLEEKITKISETTQIEADFMETISKIFTNIAPTATIAEAEERMQKLSDKIDELETDKRKLIAALGGARSGNSKLRKKNRAIELDKKKLLKELKAYETKAKSELDSSEDNGGYISKKLRPVKPKPQKTRLKNRVKNYQAKNILKEITEEKERTQDV